MLKISVFFCFLCAGLLFFSQSPVQAQGFSTLKAAGSGLDGGGGGDGEEGEEGASGGGGSSGGKTGRSSRRASTEDYLFIGVFETYNPAKRSNARLSVYGDPAQFKYADRTCNRIRQVRDRINTILFKRPPAINGRGQVETAGIDKNVRLAVKNAMKTEREYFNSFYVVNGRFSHKNLPKELENKPVSNCEAVIAKAKELEKEK